MRWAVAVVSVGAMVSDLLMAAQADLTCILLGWLLVPLAGVLGALHAAILGRGWWGLALLVLAIVAVVGTISALGTLLRCFEVYDGSCQEPSPTEQTEAT